IIAMVDFWRWEYNYGHNLDPKAAIIVPGMAYQPPLIGFKQLLNFGAYSVPDKGGWFFIISGLLMLVSVLNETKFFNRFKNSKSKVSVFMMIAFILGMNSCVSNQPEPIVLNRDNCEFCKMTITDSRFGCELITSKGRFYKFDDIGCLLRYKVENKKTKYLAFFVNDYSSTNTLIDAETAIFIESSEFKSPMGGNIAAFNDKNKALSIAKKYNVLTTSWDQIDQ
ncbi:MAG: nitrous oxide reductase accessory protein NosL, partial [Bacteroidia bacterium]